MPRRAFPYLAAFAAMVVAGVTVARALGGDTDPGLPLLLAARLFVPLIILRRWLLGGILAIVVDSMDHGFYVDLTGFEGFGVDYSRIDKALDAWYLGLEVFVALTWASPYLRVTALLLFVYRLAGTAIFEATDARVMLVIFPNVFESWWLYSVLALRRYPGLMPRSRRALAVQLLLLTVPKIGQEYLLHVARIDTWHWTVRHVLRPAGIHVAIRPDI